MSDKLYVVSGSIEHDADYVNGINKSTEYSNEYIVVGDSKKMARHKFQKNHPNPIWNISEVRKLREGSDIPLEKRLKILWEVLPIIK